MTTYKEFAIIPAAIQQPDRRWKIQGAITPAEGDGFGENLFEGQNSYPSKDAAEQHFLAFAKRYIDGNATRADIDENQ